MSEAMPGWAPACHAAKPMVTSVPRPETTAVKIWLVALAVIRRTMLQAAMSPKAAKIGRPVSSRTAPMTATNPSAPPVPVRVAAATCRRLLRRVTTVPEMTRPAAATMRKPTLTVSGMEPQTSATRLTAASTTRIAAAPDSRYRPILPSERAPSQPVEKAVGDDGLWVPTGGRPYAPGAIEVAGAAG